MPTGTHTNGRIAAVSAQGLTKRYRLGEHRGLMLTLQRWLNNSGAYHNRRDELGQRFAALSDVNFTCYSGEAIGIVGTNGSGKSTLLQIMAGTTLPSDGEMRVRGHVVPLLAVGLGFHPELTGRENVRLFAAALGIPSVATEGRMDAVTAFSELDQHMDTPVKRYSSGMLSRLSFGIAMQLPAEIYAFDEVLAVAGGEFKLRCLDAIDGLHKSGRTVMFVSHDLDLVADVCHRVMWLEKGTLREFGPAAQVLESYQREHAGPTS